MEQLERMPLYCDRLDYILAASSGALCGVVDAFLVGKPGESPLGDITDNWFGHLMSDISGSESSARKGNRGVGIPSPLWTWTNDMIAIKAKLGLRVTETDKAMNELTLNIRFLRSLRLIQFQAHCALSSKILLHRNILLLNHLSFLFLSLLRLLNHIGTSFCKNGFGSSDEYHVWIAVRFVLVPVHDNESASLQIQAKEMRFLYHCRI